MHELDQPTSGAAEAVSPDASAPLTGSPAGSRRLRRAVAKATPPLLPTVADHPLTRRNYRVATAAIEEFVELVDNCVRLMIPGALMHARPRMGKTHAIDYVATRLDRNRPDILAYFSPSWTPFQAHRGRDFSVMVDGISD